MTSIAQLVLHEDKKFELGLKWWKQAAFEVDPKKQTSILIRLYE